MISREKALEWAKECNASEFGLRDDVIEVLINRAYQEGQKDNEMAKQLEYERGQRDMRERAADECLSRVGSDHDHPWSAQFDNEATDCADAVRSLRIE